MRQYIGANDDDSLDLTGDFTLEAWVKPDAKSGVLAIVGKWGPSNMSYLLRQYNTKIQVQLSANGTAATSLLSTLTMTVDAWNHVAAVRCGNEVSLWINGVKDNNTLTFTDDIFSGTAPLRMGATAGAGGYQYFRGEIDEVRVSNFARGDFYNPTLTYDDNGNLTSDGDMEYQYDVFNRLAKVTKAADDSTVAEYVYDGTGRRVLKTVDSDETRFIYDGNDVICEYNGNDALTCRYIMGRSIDEPMRMERLIDANWHTFYYHTNQLGTIAALTEWDDGEEEEVLIERYTEDAYGRLLVHTPGADGDFGTADDDYAATSSVGNPYGFTSRRLDSETGLM